MLIDSGAVHRGRRALGAWPGGGRHRGAADHPRAARGAARPAGARRTRHRRARLGDRNGVRRAGGRILAPEAVRPALGEHLSTLARKQFVHLSMRVDASARYRFHHQLVRDTVYNGLLKRARAHAAHRFRALGRSCECRPRSCAGVRGDPRLSPRAGAPLPERAGSAGRRGRGHRPRRCAAPGQRRHGARSRAATFTLRRTCFDGPSRCWRPTTRRAWRCCPSSARP